MMIRPVITEKSLLLANKGWYTFAVPKSLKKEDIRRVIHEVFSVDPIAVRTVSMHGKVRRVGRYLRKVRRPDWKKAIVRLKQGQTISIFESVNQQRT